MWDYTYACEIKILFFLIPSSYSGLLSLAAHCDNYLKIFSFTFVFGVLVAVVCVFGVLVFTVKCSNRSSCYLLTNLNSSRLATKLTIEVKKLKV